MISRHHFILRGSYFCEEYFIVLTTHQIISRTVAFTYLISQRLWERDNFWPFREYRAVCAINVRASLKVFLNIFPQNEATRQKIQ